MRITVFALCVSFFCVGLVASAESLQPIEVDATLIPAPGMIGTDMAPLNPCVVAQQAQGTGDSLAYKPVWVKPDNTPGWVNISAGARAGNHLSTKGMWWVSPGVVYFAWESFGNGIHSVMFTQLVGMNRTGYTGNTIDVITTGTDEIDDVKLVVMPNGSAVVSWLQTHTAIGVRSQYASVWNGKCWGKFGSAACGPQNLSWPISDYVIGHDMALDPVTGYPGVTWTDLNRTVWARQWNGSAWVGYGGGWADNVFQDRFGAVYSQINRSVMEYDALGRQHVLFAGYGSGTVPTWVRHRFYKPGTGWKGFYGATDILPVKAGGLIHATFDKLWGRLYVAGQWEPPLTGFPQNWFVLSGATKFEGVAGAAWDWVSSPYGYFPTVQSDTTSRPYVVSMDPVPDDHQENTVISWWHWFGFGGYDESPDRTDPTDVSSGPWGEWANSFWEDPDNKAHVGYTVCKAYSPNCSDSFIRYTRER